MLRKLLPLGLCALAACTAGASANTAGETSIPFVASNGIIDWRADGDEVLFIRGVGGHWYHVLLMGPCATLRNATSLGFEASALGELDHHSAIFAEGVRCQISSVTRSEGPPPKPKR
jgi:hypothetical protein